MDCDICREAVSARSDGEPEPVPAEETDAHLASCPACREWRHDLASLTRGLRLRPAVDVPDLTAAILAAAPTPDRPVSSTRGWYPRAGLAGVGIAQLTLGLAQVLGASDPSGHAGHGAASTHLVNESTAWNLALGLGMLWAALRPRASSGLIPVMAGFIAVLAPFSAHDLVVGSAQLSRIVSHALLVAGLVLLVVVHRGRRTPGDGARATDAPDSPLTGGDRVSTEPDRPDESSGRWRHLRPVSREHAA